MLQTGAVVEFKPEHSLALARDGHVYGVAYQVGFKVTTSED